MPDFESGTFNHSATSPAPVARFARAIKRGAILPSAAAFTEIFSLDKLPKVGKTLIDACAIDHCGHSRFDGV